MNQEESKVLIRHSKPTKLDTASYGTECKVVHGEKYDVYKQYSNNEEDPRWELISENNS